MINVLLSVAFPTLEMYTLREYEADELPGLDAAVLLATQFADTIETEWQKSKLFDDVQTYTQWVENDHGGSEFWAARVSYHNDIRYAKFYETVFKNHTENESQYIGMVDSFENLPPSGPWLSRLVHYQFPFPLSDRDMIIWLGQVETEAGTQFVNVTLPRSYASDQTKAFYVSVEVVTRLPDNRTKWVMATSSDAGGFVPQFVQRPQMSKAVSEDVPQFKKWIGS